MKTSVYQLIDDWSKDKKRLKFFNRNSVKGEDIEMGRVLAPARGTLWGVSPVS